MSMTARWVLDVLRAAYPGKLTPEAIVAAVDSSQLDKDGVLKDLGYLKNHVLASSDDSGEWFAARGSESGGE
jgi:hypothetical protein